MKNLNTALRENISAYGAEAILIKKVTLGSWGELSQGNVRSGYTVKTIDSLPYRFGSSCTRHVCSIEKNYLTSSMAILNKIAKEFNIVVIDNT